MQAEVMATLEGHTESVLALVLSPDDSTLYTASGDNTIKVAVSECRPTLQAAHPEQLDALYGCT
jgi:hypothetical protein